MKQEYPSNKWVERIYFLRDEKDRLLKADEVKSWEVNLVINELESLGGYAWADELIERFGNDYGISKRN